MRETRVRSLGREDPLEKEMATHSSILAWRISWMEEPGHKESDTTERLHLLTSVAVRGLSHGTGGLPSLLWDSGSFVAACKLFGVAGEV